MKCSNGHIVSSSYCSICEEKPEKKKPKPIRKVSVKRVGENKEYSVEGAKFLEENQTCQYEGCTQISEQLHHIEGRGKNINNKSTWMAICAEHHYFIHHIGPKTAREKGYLK